MSTVDTFELIVGVAQNLSTSPACPVLLLLALCAATGPSRRRVRDGPEPGHARMMF
ncbi:hypothetical protein [Streptomyces sp. SD15]